MLRSLEIRDMLIIDHLELEFQPGLNVLTGETGAGKSILLDSLGFVLGWRGRAELVRSGADTGEVTAIFDLSQDHVAHGVLDEAGFGSGEELVLRRVNFKDGRKQAYVNDRRASGDLLRRLSDGLLELHGQHDDRGLLNPRGHGDILDAFAGIDLAPIRAAWNNLGRARDQLSQTEERVLGLRQEEEFLRHAVSEIEALELTPRRDAELDARRRHMQAGARIREDIMKAGHALGSDGAEGLMGDARKWLEGVVAQADGQLDGACAALERALTELGEATQQVESCLETFDHDPHELEHVEEQLFALRGLARKHNVPVEELAGLADELRARLDSLDGGDVELSHLRQALEAAEASYTREAVRLTEIRRAAAARLDDAMSRELAPLKMERAIFSTDLWSAPFGPSGQDAVTFQVRPNPGAPAGALNKIASGGELSRFLLALKVCLSGDTPGRVMIFDEIDRGVGGATADAVGRRLADLAAGGQVLVVTHSPQVAALGQHHWRVAKHVRGEQTLSTVTPLNPEARVEEIARMVAGDIVSDAARDAAKALLGT